MSGQAVPWQGGRTSERTWCVLAPNPGPMTLEGTNTWVLLEPGSTRAVVVDPGPDDPVHLNAVLAVVSDLGAYVAQTLLTHGHPDHAAGARRFGELSRSPVRALDPTLGLGDEGLGDGDVVDVGGLGLRVIATPGHTGDSLSFLLPAESALLTGDTVLGHGTSVVAHPDGRLGSYLASIRRLHDLASLGQARTVLPGHGPALSDAASVLGWYLEHRQARLAQVQAAQDAGASTPQDVVQAVYADVDPALWPAAELSVRAQLEYLAEQQV